ncbi:hypothetical protein PIB30_006612 [Stylosanthes scabra]|uniref:RNase H type-1 domain-containing protein n=1 Tax=Stylosanthes scabra TaxID=79078 RepID=A0ABU6Z4V7_9FABA|nr:hypothetical protein [Stylosanthes scabra]
MAVGCLVARVPSFVHFSLRAFCSLARVASCYRGMYGPNLDMDIIRKIQDCLVRNWNVQFRLVKREANRVADWIAKNGAISDISRSSWIEPGSFLQNLLLSDINRVI